MSDSDPVHAPGSSPGSHDSPWVPAVRPGRPPRLAGPDLVTVDDAVVTGVRRGGLNTNLPPRRWIAGAVHGADGELLRLSQRWWAGDPKSPVAADPEQVRVPQDAPRLTGTWLYVGHWLPQFGHFLMETLTNLWPDPREMAAAGVAGLLGHRDYRGPVPVAGPGRGPVPADLSPWQDELVRLAGYGDLPVQVVRGRPVRVDRLLVPLRPVVLKSWARRPAVDVWRRVADGVPEGPPTRLFLSRRRFHERDRPAGRQERRVRVEEGWDETLERVFAEAGFQVVHPETRPVSEQVALARAATVVAGSSGSQLHLAAFARPGTRVLEIGDLRVGEDPLPAQQVIGAACEHLTAFVPYGDLAQLRRCLASL